MFVNVYYYIRYLFSLSIFFFFFFSSRRRHTRCSRDWSSDVCSSDLFLGSAGYACAHAAKVWSWPPELAIVFGAAGAAALGVGTRGLGSRSRGNYLANLTLAFAPMIYFFSLQAKLNRGADRIPRAPPR